MSRMRRHNIPGIVYHCIWRFVGREFHFDLPDARSTYLRMLGHALEGTDWRCLSYAIMSNHIHLALVAGRLPMESWTRRVNPPFAIWVNERRERIGPVFAGRAKDLGFLDSRVPALLAYIHNNPVKHQVVKHADASPWTSHQAYLGWVEPPTWLHVDEGLHRVGITDREVFGRWIVATPGEREDFEFVGPRLDTRRRGAVDPGTPVSDGDQTMIPLVARPFAHIRPDPVQVIERVAALTRIDAQAICSRRRLPTLCAARAVVIRAGVELGITKSDLAAALGISAQAVNVIARRGSSDDQQRCIDLVRSDLVRAFWPRAAVV